MPIPAPTSRVPVHPGGILEDAIHARGTTAEALCAATGLDLGDVRAILAERAPITARVALLLAAYFGTAPEFWTNLQTAYDLDRARMQYAGPIGAVAALPGVAEEEPAPPLFSAASVLVGEWLFGIAERWERAFTATPPDFAALHDLPPLPGDVTLAAFVEEVRVLACSLIPREG
jgi:addiction module HigA family antidote